MNDLSDSLIFGEVFPSVDSLARYGDAAALDLVNETHTSGAQRLFDRK